MPRAPARARVPSRITPRAAADDSASSSDEDPNIYEVRGHARTAADDDDEEIDEDAAFTEADQKKWGSFFPRAGSKRARADRSGGSDSKDDDGEDEEEDGSYDTDADDDDDDLDEDADDADFFENDDDADDDDDDDAAGVDAIGAGTDSERDAIAALVAQLVPDDVDEGGSRKKSIKRARRPLADVEPPGVAEDEFTIAPARSGSRRGMGAGASAALGAAARDSGIDIASLTAALLQGDGQGDASVPGMGALKKRLEKLVGRALHATVAPSAAPVHAVPLTAPPAAPVVQRSARAAAYAETSARVGAWTAPVAAIRRAAHVSFSAEAALDTRAPASTAALSSSFAPVQDFEASVAAALAASGMGALPGASVARAGRAAGDAGVVAAEADEAAQGDGLAAAPAPTAAALAERTAALQKMRALLFYDELRRRRANRIKSKTFRRLKKRADTAAGRAAMEELAKTDPEAAAALEAEEARVIARERVSQKHRASGKGVGGSKWVKRVLARGKATREGADAGSALAEHQRRAAELKSRIEGHRARENGGGDDDDGSSASGTDSGDDLGLGAKDVLLRGAAAARAAAASARAGAQKPPEKGLLGMKFMRAAAERAAASAPAAAEALADELDALAHGGASRWGDEISDGDECGDGGGGAAGGGSGAEHAAVESSRALAPSAAPATGRHVFVASAASVGRRARESAGTASRMQARAGSGAAIKTTLSRPSELAAVDAGATTSTPWMRQGGAAVFAVDASERTASQAAGIADVNPWLNNVFSTGERAGGRHAGSKRASSAAADAATSVVLDAALPLARHRAFSGAPTVPTAPGPIPPSAPLGAARDRDAVAREQAELVRRAFVSAGDDGAGGDILEADRNADAAANAAAAPKIEKRARARGAEAITAPTGWGSWSGMGADDANATDRARADAKEAARAEKRRRRAGGGELAPTAAVSATARAARAAAASAAPPPRRDARLTRVMLSERRDRALAAHQLPALPPGVPSADALAAATRAPIGAEWNAASVTADLTKPAWTTRTGTIIEPLATAGRARKGDNKDTVRARVAAISTGQGAKRKR